MAVISMKQLLEAGVHFGHQTRRWNPKMARYIFTERNGVYIIDLQKTVRKVDEAYNFLRSVAQEGKSVLFIGTKKQAQDAVKEEATKAEMFYVNERWLGGMMTNFQTIQRRIHRLKTLEEMEENGTLELLTKKEVQGLRHEKEKLERYLGGIHCACFTPNSERIDDILRLAREYRADGVIDVNLKFCNIYDTEGYFVERALKDAGIPVLGVETDYTDQDAEQLKTRIGAFLEMLGGR